MIQIIPVSGIEREELLSEMGGSSETEAVVLAMKEKDKLLGGTAVDIQHSSLLLKKIYVKNADISSLTPEQRFLADSLLRAAASYGANQCAYQIISWDKEAEPFLLSEGFREIEDGKWVLPMEFIVKNCKDS